MPVNTKDYTKSVPLPPAAKPVAIPQLTTVVSQLPLPAGQVQLGRVSPLEEQRLKKMGWTGQATVPANLAEISDEVKRQLLVQEVLKSQEQNDQEALAEIRTKVGQQQPLQVKEVDMAELPPELQATYQQIMQDVFTQSREVQEEQPDVSGLDPTVARAVLEAAANRRSEPEVTDDRGAPNYATGMPKLSELAQPLAAPPADNQPSQENQDSPEQDRTCARCGFPKRLTEDLPVTEDDKSAYFQAVVSLEPFYQTIPLFGDKASITVRTLTPVEVDQLFLQVGQDGRAGLVPNFAVEMELTARYRMALQLVEINFPGARRVFPKSLEAWNPAVLPEELQHKGKLRCVLETVMGDIGTNESLYRLLAKKVSKFNMTVSKLESLVSEPDFWQAVGT